jgi:hypothetical protein
MRRPTLKILDKALAAARAKRAAALRAERLRPVTDAELRERFVRLDGAICRRCSEIRVNVTHPRGWIVVRKHRVTFERLDKALP